MNQRLLIAKLFFSCLIIIQAIALRAQPTFTIPVVNNASNGQILDLPVTVSNFDSLVSVQFVLLWDPTVLEFQEVNQFGLPDLDITKFGTTEAVPSGILRFAWWRFVAEGNSVPNGTAIFHLKMKVIGPINSGTSINFTELPPLTYFEVLTAGSTVYGPNDLPLNHGFVAVGYTVSATEPDGVSSLKLFPNPTSDHFTLEKNLTAAATYRLRIVDVQGRTEFFETDWAPAGLFRKQFDAAFFPTRGAHWLIFETDHLQITKYLDITD